jgi:hypothetical protein
MPRAVTDTPPPDAFVSSRARGKGRSWWFQLLCELGGVRMAAILIGTLTVVVALATVHERAYGTLVTTVMVYQSWWFTALFALLAACLIAAVAVRLPLKRHQWGFAVVHLGLLVLMGGFWAHGYTRLDGMLEAPPGVEATRIDLPSDALIVVEDQQRTTAEFQPVAHAGYPSLAAFTLYDLWADPPAAIHRLPRPLRLIDSPRLSADLVAVLDTGAPELGFAPAASGPPAALLTLSAADASGALEPFARGWLTRDGESVLDQGLVIASLMVASSPHLADGFGKPLPPAGEHGELVVGLADRAVRVPATPGSVHELAADLALRVERIVPNPRPKDGDLVQDDGARFDPVIEYSLGRGVGEARQWTRRFAAALLVAPGGDGFPEVLYEHPGIYRASSGQGAYLQLLAVPGPDGPRLRARWFTRSKGLSGAADIDRTWSADLVGGMGGPMRLNARIDWLPRAEQAPEPVDMQAGKQDRAARWIRVRFAGEGATHERWLRREDPVAVQLGGRTLFVSYRKAVHDLRERNGFAVRLDRFDEGKDPGGMRSASFASDVTVVPAGGEPYAAHITMNEPLHHAGVTLYQTAFRPELDAQGQPTGRQISVFTAATDPGRPLKYLGSLLVVLGIIMLFTMRRRVVA